MIYKIFVKIFFIWLNIASIIYEIRNSLVSKNTKLLNRKKEGGGIMKKLNCWEFKKCGREPEGKNSILLGVCPVATLQVTDGICGGVNGGRVCGCVSKFLDLDTNETRRLSGLTAPVDKCSHRCENCSFYEIIKDEEKEEQQLLDMEDQNSKLKKWFSVSA
ncbi:MAG TPA: hypothetical protein DD381_10585 [Lentisphaeria bacterium]|nr:MAG: hypothetical protein A2X47_02085 [Lentisphaerae bacterium GWF2_38_69]HBM16773.1 hypothetical protein [Lentisphaeria bacterium]